MPPVPNGPSERMRQMLVHLLPAICASMLGASACQQDQPTGVTGPRVHADLPPQRDTALAPSADTYIRQGSPNQNQGAEVILRLQSSGKNRALLRWDQAALVQAVAGGTVTSARLQLTIADLGDNWSTPGRTIELHRMTQAWTELGATWNCATDSVPGNSKPDCTGATAWDMDHSAAYPFVAETSATARLRNGQTGVVSFDVTADVLAWLSGQPNDGWVLKKTVEGDPGMVDFGSRERATPPQLVLLVRVAQPSWPLLTDSYPTLDTSLVVRHPIDTALIYFRTDVVLRFKPGTSDSTEAAFFARNSLQVLGVTRSGQFFVKIPDPGSALQNLYDAIDRLEGDPVILLVAPIPRQPWSQEGSTRLPTDGPGQARADWLSNASTWAMRAIRAPLAWGCETGEYGGAAIPVGLFEWKQEPSHPELQPSMPHLWEPSDALLKAYQPVPPDTAAAKRAHAIATSGLLSARGDNGSGIAGMDWRTRLFMYAGYSPNNRPLDLTTGFFLVSEAISADRIRVLSLSADAEFPDSIQAKDRERFIEDVIGEMQSSLIPDSSPLLVVVAAGNESYLGTVTSYPTAHRATLLRSALLRLAQDSHYRDRIVVVTGTAEGNRLWSGGNVYTGGASDIAAPAAGVTVLGPWHGETGPAVPVTVKTGTSLSAPLVAGVAAQLWAMDPDLSPQDVKRYIVRGAQVPRLNPTTGQIVPVASVSGAPETIYQLDAYGALTLLSKEHPEVPLCGVSADLAPAPDSQTFDGILLRRLPALGDTVRLSLASFGIQPDGASLAQGGRLIAVSGGNEQQPYRTVFLDQQGRQARAPLEGIERRFLERDSVDLDWTVHASYPLVTLRRGDTLHTISHLDPVSAVVPDTENVYDARVVMSPSGEYAAVYAGANLTAQCGVHSIWAVVRLSDGAVTPILDQTDLCGGVANSHWPGGMAWTPDSRRVTVLTRHFQDLTCGVFVYETVVTTFDIGGSPQSVSIPGFYLGGPAYTADGALFSAFQWGAPAGGCSLGLRPAANLATTSGTPGLPYSWDICYLMAPDARGPSSLASPQRAAPPRPSAPLQPQRADCQPLAPPKR